MSVERAQLIKEVNNRLTPDHWDYLRNRTTFLHGCKTLEELPEEKLLTLRDNQWEGSSFRFYMRLVEKKRQEAIYEEQVAKRKREMAIDRELERLRQQIPNDFEELTLKGAPRPKQFGALSEFFDDEAGGYWKQKPIGLWLLGETGTGKTAAAWALTENAIQTGAFVDWRFLDSVELMRKIKFKHLDKDNHNEFAQLFEKILHVDLLILDDFGTERASEASREALFELLDTRTKHHRFTVITSNLTREQFAFSLGDVEAKVLRRLKQFFHVLDFDKQYKQ